MTNSPQARRADIICSAKTKYGGPTGLSGTMRMIFYKYAEPNGSELSDLIGPDSFLPQNSKMSLVLSESGMDRDGSSTVRNLSEFRRDPINSEHAAMNPNRARI